MKIKTLPISFLALILALFCSQSVLAQSIEVSPRKGWQGKMMDVGISGTNTNFVSATSTCGAIDESKIMFHQGMTTFGVESVQLESDVQLYTLVDIAANAPTGLYDVILWPGQGGCTVTCEDCFEIFPPSSIIGVDPDSANINSFDLDVTISADFTCFTQGSSTCQANPASVRFIESSGGSASFTPNSVQVLDDKTIIANIDLPSFTAVGTYDVVVAEDFPCEATCEECFEVLPEPFFEVITGNSIPRGGDSSLIVEIFFADLLDCAYGIQNVYLVNSTTNAVIFPTGVTVNGQMIVIDVTVPDDADIGDYNIVIGDGLGSPCSYFCADCFRVDPALSTSPRPIEDQLLVYPNPNDGQFTVMTGQAFFDTCLEIYDVSGRRIVSERLERMEEHQVNLPAKGVYIMKLATQESTMVQRIIVE